MEKDLLLKLYLEKPACQIAKEYNLRPDYVQRLLRLHNIPKPFRDMSGKALDVDLVRDLHYNKNIPIKDISSNLNASIGTISNIIYDDQSPKRKPTAEELQDCLNQNMLKKDIALIYNINEYELTKLLLKYNLLPIPIQLSKDQLKLDYQSMSINLIARKYNVSSIIISTLLKQHGLLQDIDIDEFKRLYCDERKPIKDLITIFNSSMTTICRIIKRYKLYRNPFNPDPQEFLKLFNNKTKRASTIITEMAQFYGVSTGMIKLTAQRLQLRKNTPIKFKFTQEQLEDLYNQHGILGMSILFNTSSYNIKRALTRHGIKFETPIKKPTITLNVDEISNLYTSKYGNLKSKFAIEEIAKELNIKPTPLHNFMRLNKITR